MKQTRLQVIAHYYVTEGHSQSVADALMKLAAASRQEPDNLSYEVFHHIEDNHYFLIIEKYRSATGLRQHRETEHFKAIGVDIIAPLLMNKRVDSFTIDED